MKRFTIVHAILYGALLCINNNAHARVVGSDTASARQAATFFPVVDTDNQMLGFSAFEKGLMLESAATTCVYNAFFPISGNIVLNGGYLTLIRDLDLKSPCTLGPGTMDGGGLYSISTPSNVSAINIPWEGHEKLLTSVYSTNAGAAVNSVDWSFDNKYVAVARQGATGNDVQIYYVNDLIVTLTNGIDFGTVNVNTIRWHPSGYYFAVGAASGNSLRTYYLNVANGTLQQISSLAATTVNAIAWGPLGDRLAVGRSGNANMLVYNVAAGVLGTSYTAAYGGGNRTVQKNALDWDASGSYVAAGLNVSGTSAELEVFRFTGSALTLFDTVETGVIVYSVCWHPSGLYLAVGLAAGTDRLALYAFDAVGATLTPIVAQAKIANIVYALRWNSAGTHIIAAAATSTLSYDINILSFDPVLLTLNQAAGYRVGTTCNDVAWSHDGAQVCSGDTASQFRIFNYSYAPTILKDVNLFLNSDVVILGPIIFQGNCLINGEDKTCHFGAQGSLAVAPNSSLIIERSNMEGITANCIGCASDTSVLTLKNVSWNQDGVYTFSVGALRLQEEVLMSGDATFAYNTSQTSTICSLSELTLDHDFTLSYDPGIPSKALFEFEDATSQLTLNGATLHATVTGLQLTRGKVRALVDSYIASEISVDAGGNSTVDEGITFGDGIAEDDATLSIYGGVTLQLNTGTICYKNVNAQSLRFYNIASVLAIGSGAALKLYQSMNPGAGAISFGDNALVSSLVGKKITGSIRPFGRLRAMTFV